MKITSFGLTNWMRHREVSHPLSPLTIIAGPNESGKSSVGDAIAFAVTGAARRVASVAARKDLIRLGAKAGSVTLEADGGRITRGIEDAKLTDTHPIAPGARAELLPVCLAPALFAGAKADDRRNAVLTATGRTLTPARLVTALKRRKHADALVDALPVAKGHAAMFDHAKEQASQARGVWKATTGETYGAKKAEGWKAPAPQRPIGTEESLRAAVDVLRAQLLAAQRIAQSTSAVGALRARAAKLIEAQAVLDATKKAETAAGAELEASRRLEQGTIDAPATKVLECPDCGAELHLTAGELVNASGDTSTPTQKAEAAARLSVATKAHQTAQRDRAAAEESARDATAAQAALAALGTVNPVGIAQDAAELSDELRAAERGLADLVAADLAAAKTTRAATAHAEVLAWTAIQEALAPSGIPADALGAALVDLNKTLAEAAAATGWKPVTVTEDMEISCGAYAYALLSESAQWRVDAMIAVAIAVHSKLKLVLLDRFDVLDLPNRSAALKWLQQMTAAGTLDTVVIMATLKAAPKAPPGVGVIWLGEAPAEKVA